MTVRSNNMITQKIHRDAVLGKDVSLPRSIAINMLPLSNLPDSVNLLKMVLKDDAEKSQFRRLAAINLWKINKPSANEHLLEAAKSVKDPETLSAVVKCLGRVGDEHALKVIKEIQATASGYLATQTNFAASLISYRLGMPGQELKIPNNYIEMPQTAKINLEFVSPKNEEINKLAISLANESFGILYSYSSCKQYSCPGGTSIIALNQQISNESNLEILMDRKTLLGVTASKNEEDESYYVTHLILTSPDALTKKINISVHRTTGEIAWAGVTTSVNKYEIKFIIKTAGRIGIVPIEVAGSLSSEGILSIVSAVTTGIVLEKRHPERINITF